MTTILTRSPVQAAADSAAARLEAFLPLTRAVARRWARRMGWDGTRAEDLAQEAALALWRVLQERPDAPAAYLKDVADHAARDALERGKSVDRPLPRERARTWQVISLDLLMENEGGPDTIEEALARRKRRGELPSPTEEVATARIMLRELRERLTPRQGQVMELRLQGYTREEIGARLGLGQTRVNTIITIIQKKAGPLWQEEPVPASKPVFMTASELAREMKYSHVQACRLCREGKIPGARRAGKRWLIPAESARQGPTASEAARGEPKSRRPSDFELLSLGGG
ncbi:MAG: sigma-70 family RNA polymerase sigma factor [Chloroflexi bacterium]|nr:sigma-70 family RNA polymerase sigma factor [Chloroflexota bacterium]